MKFKYKAKKGLDQVVEGVMDEISRDVVVNRLMDQGLFPVSVEEADVVRTTDRVEMKNSWFGRRRVSSGDVLLFTRKLATLVRARLELLPAMKIIYEQAEHPALRDVMFRIYLTLREGKPLSEALSTFPRLFSPLYVNIIKAGEAAGALDAALSQIISYLSNVENTRKKVVVALAYPSVLLLVGVASIVVLMNVVIPKLKPIFDSLGDKVPPLTRFIIGLSTVSSRNILSVALMAVIVIYLVYRNRHTPALRRAVYAFKARMPVVSRIMANQQYEQLSRSLAILLRSRVSALESMEIARHTVDDPGLREGLGEACRRIGSGHGLAQSLGAVTGLPDFFIRMIAIGEESGRLGEVLEEVTDAYARQVESDITLMSSLLEPLLILGLGVILGSIVLAILIPMFQATQIVN